MMPEHSEIQIRQLKAAIRLTLLQGLRPIVNASTGKISSHPLKQLLFGNILFGILFAYGVNRFADGNSFLIFLFTNVLVIVGLSVIPDTHETRQKNVEVLHSKPVNQKTLAVARASVLFVYAGLITCCLSTFPLCVGFVTFKYPWWIIPGSLCLLMMGGCSLVIFWLTGLMVANRWLSFDKIKLFSQLLLVSFLLLTTGISFGFFSSFTSDSYTSYRPAYHFSAIPEVRLLPTVWFVDFLTRGFDLVTNLERCGVLAIIGIAFGAIWGFDIEGYYPKMIEHLSAPEMKPAQESLIVWFLRLARKIPLLSWLFPEQTAAVASLIVTVSQREEISRLKVLLPRVLIVVFFLVSLDQQYTAVPLFLMAYYSFSCLIDGVDVIRQNSHAEASWVFHNTPLRAIHLARGIQLGVLLRFFTFPAIFMMITFFLNHAPLLAAILTVGYFLAAQQVVLFFLVLTPSIPLSHDQKAAQSLIGFAFGFGVMTCAGVAYMLLVTFVDQFGAIGLYFGLAGLALLAVMNYSFERLAAQRISKLEYQH